MIRFCVLGSGSSGNATYFNVDGYQFLIDCGFTKPGCNKRLASIGKTTDDIQAVFVTHNHGDHVKPWIFSSCLVPENPDANPYITRFLLSHDVECFGYVVQDKDGNKVALIADTGCITEEVVGHCFDCSAILVETNYDVDMLAVSPYPAERMDRIAAENGHLRNECAAEFVEMVASDKLKFVVGMHLSSANNNPDLVRFCLESVVHGKGVEVIISEQKTPTKMMVLM